MKISVYQTSHQGGRSSNEDRMGYCHTSDSLLMLLADGMGGHPEGEMASQIAVQTIASLFQKHANPTIENPATFLEAALLTAHRQILRYAIDRGMPDSPRTTLVAAVVQNGEAQWIHCGDSRLYLIRDQRMVTRTKDHSYSELRESIVMGSTHHINRNVLFTCLGSPSRPIYDISQAETLHQGDRILLCSDGLWGSLDDQIIVQHIAQGALKTVGTEVVDLAFRTAGKSSDNITIVALDWQEAQANKQSATASMNLYDDLPDEDSFVSTISGELLEDADIEQSLDEISQALKNSRGY